MENIEQLRQDNAKLTERLNKAANFFREQKAQIESLTKENEELKGQINRTPQEEIISKEDWNKLVNEKENLQKQIEGYENERKSNEAYSDDLNKQCDKYELKVQELENQIKEFEKFEAETINVKVPELQEKLDNAKKIIEDNKIDYDKLQKEHETLNKTYNKLNNEYSEIYTKYNDLEQERIKSEEQLNVLNTLCVQFKEDNKALQDKYDNLEKICNDFENQKLAADADYQGVLDMYQELQKEYERLRNERDIYSQSDDVLAEIIKILIEKDLVNKNELTQQTSIKENGTNHRIGSNLECGYNVGV